MFLPSDARDPVPWTEDPSVKPARESEIPPFEAISRLSGWTAKTARRALPRPQGTSKCQDPTSAVVLSFSLRVMGPKLRRGVTAGVAPHGPPRGACVVAGDSHLGEEQRA